MRHIYKRHSILPLVAVMLLTALASCRRTIEEDYLDYPSVQDGNTTVNADTTCITK
ncbi:MAG: hypothetical protein J5900_03105 [Prevotella sp.]|nr:hypothetical protein [Prevotella sp.]MBQ6760084.1 hypothetical protein [Prevotella sp.]